MTTSSVNRRRVAAKKQHELSHLVPLIDQLCRKVECRRIVDIGCGTVSIYICA